MDCYPCYVKPTTQPDVLGKTLSSLFLVVRKSFFFVAFCKKKKKWIKNAGWESIDQLVLCNAATWHRQRPNAFLSAAIVENLFSESIESSFSRFSPMADDVVFVYNERRSDKERCSKRSS